MLSPGPAMKPSNDMVMCQRTLPIGPPLSGPAGSTHDATAQPGAGESVTRRRSRTKSLGIGLVDKDLGDASRLFQGGEVAGVRHGDPFRAHQHPSVGLTLLGTRPVVIAVDDGHR